jgi:hypothetical protein
MSAHSHACKEPLLLSLLQVLLQVLLSAVPAAAAVSLSTSQ